MSLVLGALFIMAVLSIFSMIFGEEGITTILEGGFGGSQTVNGTSSDLSIDIGDLSFGIDPVLGMILGITILGIIIGLIGVQVVGSGLSDTSVRVVTLAIIYGGLWTILSILSRPLIVEIEIFGTLIYIVLTIIYVIGVFQKAFGGEEV